MQHMFCCFIRLTHFDVDPNVSVKNSIYDINDFDIARMLKPIIDQKEVRFFDSFWYNHLQTVTNQSFLLAWKWHLDVFNQDINYENNILRGEASHILLHHNLLQKG